MCSRVNVVGVRILDNPSKPTDPFKLEITFELFENIKEGFFQYFNLIFILIKRLNGSLFLLQLTEKKNTIKYLIL